MLCVLLIHANPFQGNLLHKETVVGTFFSGGVRIYSIADPGHPEEIAYLIPEAPPGTGRAPSS